MLNQFADSGGSDQDGKQIRDFSGDCVGDAGEAQNKDEKKNSDNWNLLPFLFIVAYFYAKKSAKHV